MNAIRYKDLLNQQPAVARKVFDAVPIQDAWPVNKIIGEMIRSGLPRLDLRTADGCLNRLKDAGLVKEPDRGIYQRVVPHERETLKLEVCRASAPPPPPPPPCEVAVAVPVDAPPTVVLGELASSLRSQAAMLNAAADEIDKSAIVFEERIDITERRLSRFRELSALLKEF